MDNTILIADDDSVFRAMVKRALARLPYTLITAANGDDALRLALEKSPGLILLDVDMPGRTGPGVLQELRTRIETRGIPVIMVSAMGAISDKVSALGLGADDYITKPFAMEELIARVQSTFRRTQRDVSSNPLTRLPGSPAIEEEVDRRIREKRAFAFFYVDIDHFKAFNDAYGYAEGDRVIRDTAALLMETVNAGNRKSDFLGHIGGDDFVLITEPEAADAVAGAIVAAFDAKAGGYYSAQDRGNGFVRTRDRLGREQKFPLISLTIAIATTEKRKLTHHAKVVEIASEIKRYLKSLKGRKGSLALKDRWEDEYRPTPPGPR